MFERFTESARQVVVHAQDEARRLGHPAIDTPHLLLGVLREGDGRGADALESLGVSIGVVLEHLPTGGGRVAAGMMPFTPRAKRALEDAAQEARELRRPHVDTDDLLLALVRRRGPAANLLADLGASRHEVRMAVGRARAN